NSPRGCRAGLDQPAGGRPREGLPRGNHTQGNQSGDSQLHMTLFPLTRPRLGLSIGAHAHSLVEITRDWRRAWQGSGIRSCRVRELPDGLVRPSASDPNVSDVGALVEQVLALLGGQRRPWEVWPVALSLPDLCARVALFEFEAWPQKAAEGEALLRWRFQKELNVPPDARLAYRLFPSGAGSRPNGAAAGIQVLAGAVSGKVLEQYERVCEEAGLLPLNVNLSSLALFDFCRPAMLRSTGGKGPLVAHEVFFLSVMDGGYSFFALRDGFPVFLRMKAHRDGMTSDEVVSTIQFYDESQPEAAISSDAKPRPFYVVGSEGLLAEPCRLVLVAQPFSRGGRGAVPTRRRAGRGDEPALHRGSGAGGCGPGGRAPQDAAAGSCVHQPTARAARVLLDSVLERSGRGRAPLGLHRIGHGQLQGLPDRPEWDGAL